MEKIINMIVWFTSASCLMICVFAVSTRLDLNTGNTIALLGVLATLVSVGIAYLSLNKTLKFNRVVEYRNLLNQQLNSTLRLNYFIKTFGDIHFKNSFDNVSYKENLEDLKTFVDNEILHNELACAGENIYLVYFKLVEHIEGMYSYYVHYDNEVELMQGYSLYQRITDIHNEFVTTLSETQYLVREEIKKNHPNNF